MEEEIVDNDYETVNEDIEAVEDDEVVANDVDVVAKPDYSINSIAGLLREAENWIFLPNSLERLYIVLFRAGRYAECLQELRERLKKDRSLYKDILAEIEKELQAQRAKIYAIGLKALLITRDCRLISPELEELREACFYATRGIPKYVWRVLTTKSKGARRPDILLSYLCRYKISCCKL